MLGDKRRMEKGERRGSRRLLVCFLLRFRGLQGSRCWGRSQLDVSPRKRQGEGRLGFDTHGVKLADPLGTLPRVHPRVVLLEALVLALRARPSGYPAECHVHGAGERGPDRGGAPCGSRATAPKSGSCEFAATSQVSRQASVRHRISHVRSEGSSRLLDCGRRYRRQPRRKAGCQNRVSARGRTLRVYKRRGGLASFRPGHRSQRFVRVRRT